MLIAHGPHIYSTLSSTCLAILLLEACTYPFSIVCLTLAPTVFTYHIAGNIGGLQTLRFGPKLTVKKYWQNLNLAVASQVCSTSLKERCHLSLEVLEQSHKFTNLQEIKLAAC